MKGFHIGLEFLRIELGTCSQKAKKVLVHYGEQNKMMWFRVQQASFCFFSRFRCSSDQ
jgi:hypothetical protein